MRVSRRVVIVIAITLLITVCSAGTAVAGTDSDTRQSYQGYLIGYHQISTTTSSCYCQGDSRATECPYDEYWDEVKVILAIYKGGHFRSPVATASAYAPSQYAGTSLTRSSGGYAGAWEGDGSHYAYFWGVGSDVVYTSTYVSESRSEAYIADGVATYNAVIGEDVTGWTAGSVYDLEASGRYLTRAENIQLHCAVGSIVEAGLAPDDLRPGLSVSPLGMHARVLFFDGAGNLRQAVSLEKYTVDVPRPGVGRLVPAPFWRVTH